MRDGIKLGMQRGRLTVIGEAARRDGIVWDCRCDCGAIVQRRTSQLNRSKAPHCGCSRPQRTHGLFGTHLYSCYRNMLSRCYNPNVDRYSRYGGRGIRVCDAWRSSFEAFAAWADAAGYNPDLSLDRIEVDGSYGPENCRWVDMLTQARNRGSTRRLTWDGETLTVREWAEKLSVPYDAMQLRVTRGWSADRIFTQPFRRAA